MSKQGKKLKRKHIVIKGAAKNKTSSRPDRTSSPTCIAFSQDDEEMGGMGGADDATENEEGVSLGEAVGKIAGGVAALWTSSFSMIGPLINREFRDRVFVATFLAITIQEFFDPHVAKMTMMVMATLFSAAVFAPKSLASVASAPLSCRIVSRNE